MLVHKTYHVICINTILISVSCLTCKDVQEFPKKTKLRLEVLQTMKPGDIVECISHLGRKKVTLAEADFIWYNIIKFYNGLSHIPDKVLSSLHWVTTAVKAEDYANFTLNDIEVISNFGFNYNLTVGQLQAIAVRVRQDFARKRPEDYTSHDLTALNQILCAFYKSEIDRIHPKAYKGAAIVIGQLKDCNHEVIKGFAKLAVHKDAFGPFKKWDEDTREELGVVTENIKNRKKNT